MKKYIIATIATLLLTGVATAQSDFDGLYAGASGGFSSGMIELKDGSSVFDAGGQGLNGQVFVGYGMSSDAIYYGIEATAGYSNLVQTTKTSSSESKLSSRENFGAYGRLGLSPTESSLIYGIAGISYTNWEIEGSTNESHKVLAYRVGLGSQHMVTDDAFVRLSFDADIPTEPFKIGSTDVTPVTQTARVGFGFQF